MFYAVESLAWNGPVLQFLQGGGSGTKQIAEFSKDLRVINRVSGCDYLPYRALRNKTQRKRVEEELSRACEEPKQLYRGNDLDLFETEIQACNERESARASLRPPLTAQLAQLEGRLANVTTLLDRGARITSSNLNEFYAFFPGKPIVRSSRPWSCTITNSHASFVVGLRNLVKR